MIKLADFCEAKKELRIELQKEGPSTKPGQEIIIKLKQNTTTGPLSHMQHVAAVADAARDLESQGDLFVACASSEIPDEVTWSMKNPFSKLSARRSELAHETGLPSAPAGSRADKVLKNVYKKGSTRAANMLVMAHEKDANEKTCQANHKDGVRALRKDDSVLKAIQQNRDHPDSLKSSSFSTGLSASHYNISRPLQHQSTVTNYFGQQSRSGFRNLGNSCYMAAVVSVLVHLKPFVADLEMFAAKLMAFPDKARVEEAKGKMAFFDALLKAARNAASKNHGVMDLTELKRAIGLRVRLFSGNEQQDAHEFYSGCIDAVYTDMMRSIKLLSAPIANAAGPGGEQKDASSTSVGEACKHKEVLSTSQLQDLKDSNACSLNVNLQVTHTLICENTACGYSRDRRELFRDLSLSVPNKDADSSVEMSELLDAFFADNLLEYTCEKCGQKQARATHALHRLPRFLVIHCKRFKPNFEKGIYEKLTTKVNVPRMLDLGKHCAGSTRAPPACDNADRISLVKTPNKSSASSSSADLTCSTVRAAGSKTDNLARRVSGESKMEGELEDLTQADWPPGEKDPSRKLSFEESREVGNGNSAGQMLTSFLTGEKVQVRMPGQGAARYGSGAVKRSATMDSRSDASKRWKFEGGGAGGNVGGWQRQRHLSQQEKRRQEEADLQLALQRSVEVTHRSEWVQREDQEPARLRAREEGKQGRALSEGNFAGKRKRVRQIDDDEVSMIPDDDDKPLLVLVDDPEETNGSKSVATIAERSQRKQTPYSSPRKHDQELEETAVSRPGKGGYDKGDYSLGDEDEDLRRALELSASENSVADVVGQECAEAKREQTEGMSEEEEEVSFFDLCTSDDDEPGDAEVASATKPPAALYTLQAVISHLGKSAARGHYVSDIFSGGKGCWNRHDDAFVRSLGDGTKVQLSEWPQEGYLFIYAHNSCLTSESQSANPRSAGVVTETRNR